MTKQTTTFWPSIGHYIDNIGVLQYCTIFSDMLLAGTKRKPRANCGWDHVSKRLQNNGCKILCDMELTILSYQSCWHISSGSTLQYYYSWSGLMLHTTVRSN